MNTELTFGIVALVGVLFLLWFAITFNMLVRLRNAVANAWAQVEVQLKRRHDLIPNLVETVKGYAAHERGTFDAVTRARQLAVSARGPADRAKAEGELNNTLKSLFAVAEAYPDLKANTNFLELQQELANTEDRAAYSRQFYNDGVLAYNNRRQTLPTVLIAGLLGFHAAEFFRTEQGEDQVVRVQF